MADQVNRRSLDRGIGARGNEMRVVPGTVRDQAYRNLRSAIVNGQFHPGQKLIERELCELLGVSRTSLREAIRMLEAEKLLVVEPHKGPCVAILSREEAIQIYEVRRVLEGLIGQRAARYATDAHIKELSRSLEDFEAAAKVKDLQQLVEHAATFFDTLKIASRNDIAREALDSLKARIGVLRATSMSDPGRTIQSAAEMREIFEAVQNRDEAWAAAACERHVAKASAAAQRHLAAMGENADGEIVDEGANTVPIAKGRSVKR